MGSESIEILVTVQSSRKTCGCALSVLVDTWTRFVLFDLRRREKEREKGRLSLPVTRFQRDDIGPVHIYRFSSSFDRECPGNDFVKQF